jgi:hypothetical protein
MFEFENSSNLKTYKLEKCSKSKKFKIYFFFRKPIGKLEEKTSRANKNRKKMWKEWNGNMCQYMRRRSRTFPGPGP